MHAGINTELKTKGKESISIETWITSLVGKWHTYSKAMLGGNQWARQSGNRTKQE